MTSTADMTMADLLAAYPGAQRALFRAYHIGGCSSCGFRPDETLAGVCERNGGLDPEAVLETVREAFAQDQTLMIAPADAARIRDASGIELLDIRTQEEFAAVQISGSRHFTQPLMQEILSTWPKDRLLVVVDHDGSRGLDAAAYFAGHGFTNVKCLRGGIDAWSVEVDPSLPRYTVE
ncbi:MAG TPA: rhodanese-like domain-containing protein [Terrimicrobiaceae bacterium]|nr:rhodanese-like domain-containing protein [Terrimicrobiaceae bacterium]